jgi:hypothetical protein
MLVRQLTFVTDNRLMSYPAKVIGKRMQADRVVGAIRSVLRDAPQDAGSTLRKPPSTRVRLGNGVAVRAVEMSNKLIVNNAVIVRL